MTYTKTRENIQRTRPSRTQAKQEKKTKKSFLFFMFLKGNESLYYKNEAELKVQDGYTMSN